MDFVLIRNAVQIQMAQVFFSVLFIYKQIITPKTVRKSINIANIDTLLFDMIT